MVTSVLRPDVLSSLHIAKHPCPRAGHGGKTTADDRDRTDLVHAAFSWFSDNEFQMGDGGGCHNLRYFEFDHLRTDMIE